MTHLPGRETGYLSTGTLAQYKSRLKKLWRIYPHLTDEKERDMCMKEMLKLSDKTGLELGGPTLMRGRGAPRTRFEFGEQHQAVLSEEERKWKEKIQDVGAMEKSARDLHLMELLAKQGMTPEMIEERNTKMQQESEVNKKAQELEQAMKDAVTAAQRYQETPLTDNEKALIEQAIRDSYKLRAEEERLGKGDEPNV